LTARRPDAMTEQRRAAEALCVELQLVEVCQAAVSACYPSAEQLREEAYNVQEVFASSL
jgi:hypothetical protein